MKRNKTKAMENKPLTIIEHIETIGETIKAYPADGTKCALDDEALLPCVKALQETLGFDELTTLQFAVMTYLCMEEGEVSFKEITRFMRVPLRKYPVLNQLLEKLFEDGYLNKDENYSGRSEYALAKEVKQSILNNQSPVSKNFETDLFGFADFAGTYLDELEQRNGNFGKVMLMLHRLMEANPNLTLVRWLKDNTIEKEELVILMAIYVGTVKGESCFYMRGLVDCYFRSGRDRLTLRRKMMNKSLSLFTMGMIEWEGSDFESRDYIRLTEAGKDMLFGNEASLVITEEESVPTQLINPASIPAKVLFYNDREGKEMARISDMLSKERFESVREHLRSRNMVPGVNILFYGGPGTGKTESVLQLARQSGSSSGGRPIYMVDISSIHDKYVGESEKRAKAIFTNYRKLCKETKETPILLLNEADALISKRIAVERSVDQMYNSVQNIFLEELEKFEGILIATTNLQHNFDPAFDRRFLYKLKFEKPSIAIRTQIIMERIPALSEEAAGRFAVEYDLSGGQLENVARKSVTEELVSGNFPDIETIEQFFREESGFRNARAGKKGIGF